MQRIALSWAIMLCLFGCAAPPHLTDQELQAADCGPFPTNYEAMVIQEISPQLRDPSSAQYRFAVPVKGALFKPPIAGGGVDHFGWIVNVWVNAKNVYGGYAGEQHKQLIIRDSAIQEVPTSEDIARIVNGDTVRPGDDMYR